MNIDMTMDHQWQAVQARDRSADGQFVYAVKTTGIYCRPSCASRSPRRENVEFFALPAAAEEAGYRACKRCQPRTAVIADERIQLVQRICDHICAHLDDANALALDALGKAFGYDPSHLQKSFSAALHMSPREYAEAMRYLRLKRELRGGGTVSDAVYSAGFSSSSRVYEGAGERMGMTPAQYKSGGVGVAMAYTTAGSALGVLLVAVTERGICALGIYDDDEAAEASLRAEFPQAGITRDDNLAVVIQAVLAHIENGASLPDVRFDIAATAFQWRVWEALQAIPRGETRTYAQVAAAIGQPKAVRAVASACANNHAALVIPCHRVVGSDGGLHGYKWGVARKEKLLEAERN
jgi:AraC family transcriptional regulator of adaptative response/methylated-DNA-[protein]-cysteine methyltransferase